MRIVSKREYHKEGVIMHYKEPGKYFNSCTATEVAMKKEKSHLLFYSYLLALLNVSAVNRML